MEFLIVHDSWNNCSVSLINFIPSQSVLIDPCATPLVLTGTPTKTTCAEQIAKQPNNTHHLGHTNWFGFDPSDSHTFIVLLVIFKYRDRSLFPPFSGIDIPVLDFSEKNKIVKQVRHTNTIWCSISDKDWLPAESPSTKEDKSESKLLSLMSRLGLAQHEDNYPEKPLKTAYTEDDGAVGGDHQKVKCLSSRCAGLSW